MKQRLADYVADFLAAHGVTDVFSVVGGGAMHLMMHWATTRRCMLPITITSRQVPLRRKHTPALITKLPPCALPPAPAAPTP